MQQDVGAQLDNAAQSAAALGQALQAAGAAAQGAQGAVGPPAWVQTVVAPLQQGLDNLQQTVNNLQQTVNDLRQDQQDLRQGLDNLRQDQVPFRIEAARSHNAHVTGDQEPLMGVPTAAGQVPAGFPLTRAHLLALDGPQLSALLQAYGLVPQQEVVGRRQQLAAHIRLPPFPP